MTCRDVLLACKHLVRVAFIFRLTFCVHVHILGSHSQLVICLGVVFEYEPKIAPLALMSGAAS